MLFDSSLIADSAANSWVGILLLDAEIETPVISTGAPGAELCLSATAGLNSGPRISEHWGVGYVLRAKGPSLRGIMLIACSW